MSATAPAVITNDAPEFGRLFGKSVLVGAKKRTCSCVQKTPVRCASDLAAIAVAAKPMSTIRTAASDEVAQLRRLAANNGGGAVHSDATTKTPASLIVHAQLSINFRPST